MAISAKKILFLLLISVISASAAELKVVNTFGADLPFRALLIEKSVSDSALKCIVTNDTFDNAIQKLLANSADMVLLKDDGRLLKKLPENLAYKKFAETRLLVLVNKSNPLNKIKLADFKKVWNGEIDRWSYFNGANIFSIHRFGLLIDSGEFEYVKRTLDLKEKVSHFPLGSSAEIITMTSGNPNALSLAVYENDADFSKVKLLEIIDANGNAVIWKIPHYVIFRKSDRGIVEKFLQKQD